jgi:uncharacterized phiE125 gp8 family phage protein
MSLLVTTQPPAEPVTVDEVKEHLNINLENNRHDALITAYIIAARQYCEKRLARVLVRTSFSYSFARFPSDKIVIPKAALISVESITYFDISTSPNVQTVATSVYDVDTGVCPGEVYLKYGQNWPTSRGHRNDITINFTAGYADTVSSPRDYDEQVPYPVKQAMLLFIGGYFLNREDRTDIQTYDNPTADALLDPFVLRSVS